MRWILIVLGVVAGLVAAVAVIGIMLPQNHTASRTVRFAAPPESVWAVISDVERFPEWRTGLDSVEMIPNSGKQVWREVSKSDRITFETVLAEAPSHLVTRISDKGLPFGGSWDYSLVPDGSGTRVTIVENGEVYNPLFRFVSRYLMGHASTIERYLMDLAAKLGDRYTPLEGTG